MTRCEHCNIQETKNNNRFYGWDVCDECYKNLKADELKRFKKWESD